MGYTFCLICLKWGLLFALFVSNGVYILLYLSEMGHTSIHFTRNVWSEMGCRILKFGLQLGIEIQIF